MKVLWISPIIPNDVQHYFSKTCSNRGGWIDTLLIELKTLDMIELAVLSISTYNYEDIYIKNIRYFNLEKKEKVHRFKYLIRNWKHNADLDEIFYHKIQRFIYVFKPDIIHLHGAENVYSKIIPLIIKIPYVISIQGIKNVCIINFFNGFEIRDYFSELFSRRFLYGEGSIHAFCRMKKSLPSELFAIKNSKYFLGRTQFDKGIIDLFNPSAKYFNVGEILRDSFYKNKWEYHDNRRDKIIYTTTSGATYKGLEVIIDAYNYLLSNLYNTRIKLRVGGNIKGWDIWPLIARRLRKFNLEHSIEFVGELNDESISKEIINCDVFVLASHIENSPNSLCEAMLVGSPCIAAYAGGVPSLITDRFDGLLYQDKDSITLAAKILEVLSNKKLAIEVATNARNSAIKRHDKKKIINELLNSYKSVLNDWNNN
jgi:glycosyltransferase involved in cell wall biosynthesis